jgi:hypothetical protein
VRAVDVSNFMYLFRLQRLCDTKVLVSVSSKGRKMKQKSVITVPYGCLVAVPWLRLLVVGLPPRSPGFDPGLVLVGFVVDKVALGQVFPRVLRFSPVNFIPPVLRYLEK